MNRKITRDKVPVSFRKWNNKAYAVFSSLKKLIKISTLSVAYLLFVNPGSLSANPVDTTSVARSIDLETIDITSEQLPEAFSGISRVVVTITQKEIERAAVSSVNELLEYAANIDIRQRSTNGVQADISIRGGTFDQVLVLLNGVNITDPQTGHHNLNLPLDLSLIERIEVLKGPGAWKFGPGAFSGAINIVTKSVDHQFLKAEAYLGQFGLNAQKISAGVSAGKTSHLFAASRSASNGYTDNTDYRLSDIYYNGTVGKQKNVFDFQAAYSDRNFGANSFYTAKFPNQFEAIQTYFLSVGYSYQSAQIQVEPKIYYRQNNDRYLLFRDNPALYENNHVTKVYGANVLVGITHGTKATTTLGADNRIETIYSNNLGELTEKAITSPINDAIVLDKTHSRNNFSVFAGHKRYFNKLMINFGLNLSSNNDIQGKWFIYPGLDVNYDISNHSSIQASANRTMRMPTFTDLYYKGPMNEGNTLLLPEMATGFELAYKYKTSAYQFSVSSFYMAGDNLIDWVRETVNDKWRTINYAQIKTFGTELGFKVNFEELTGNQNVIKDIRMNYTYIDQQKAPSKLISNYALNYLKHRADIGLIHAVYKNIEASWQLAYQVRNGQFEKFVEGASLGMTNYEPFFTTDLKISWKQSGWLLYAEASNLFNADYYDFGNISQPGRWMKIGVSKQIDFR